MGSQQKDQRKTLPFDFKSYPIDSAVTVGGLDEQTKLKLLRFYICTKEKSHLSECSSEEDECHVDISDERMRNVDLTLRQMMR